MRTRGTASHIATFLLALSGATTAAAQDAGFPPADGAPTCAGGWGVSVGATDVPANLPSFQVILFGPQSDAGTIGLARRTASGDVPVAADVFVDAAPGLAPGDVAYAYTLVPRAALAVGQTHVLSWANACVGVNERTYGVLPAIPLPASPAVVSATVIREVALGRLGEPWVRVELELASDGLAWADALAFRAVFDGTELVPIFFPFDSATRLRGRAFIACAGGTEDRTPRVAEGVHALRGTVGGHGVTPVVEATATVTLDCASPLYVHADDGTPLTPDEVAALGVDAGSTDAGPPGDGGGFVVADAATSADLDAAARPIDGGVGVAPSSRSGCSASTGRTPPGSLGLWVALAALSRALVRR